jgi:hypothetical protein
VGQRFDEDKVGITGFIAIDSAAHFEVFGTFSLFAWLGGNFPVVDAAVDENGGVSTSTWRFAPYDPNISLAIDSIKN